ncbi:hypothetical protein ACO3VM_06720 [Methanocaldococcus sp. 10A]
MVGIDNGFKELFGLYKAIKEIEIRRVVITLVSLVITILFIKLLNIKFTVFNVVVLFIVIKTLFDVVIYKKLPFAKISKNGVLWWISLGFVLVWIYLIPNLLNYLEINSIIRSSILIFIMPIILLLFIAVFVKF